VTKKTVVLAVAFGLAILASFYTPLSAEQADQALLRAMGSAKVTLAQGIAQVAKGTEIPTEAKYEMEGGICFDYEFAPVSTFGNIAQAGLLTMERLVISTVALVASAVAGVAQNAPLQPAPYCSDLKHVTNLAMTRERFASIIGKPRAGNFRNTSLPLTGWTECSFYGAATYTCDSQGFKTAEEAEQAQARTAQQIMACLGTWTEAKEQSSRGYLALHPALGPASITLSLDETDTKEHVVRLTIFIRRL